MDTSGEIQSVVLRPPQWCSSRSAQLTPTTKMCMPSLITLTFKDGQSHSILPEMLGDGASRDVIGGTIQHTKMPSPWVIKFQDWSWHEQSNGHEYRLATSLLEPFTPRMIGCVA